MHSNGTFFSIQCNGRMFHGNHGDLSEELQRGTTAMGRPTKQTCPGDPGKKTPNSVRNQRKLRKKTMQLREEVGRSKNTAVFSMICGSGGSKCRLARTVGAEPSGQTRDKKLHAVVARSRLPSQNVQSAPATDQFWRCRNARSTFPNQHARNKTCLDHF